jgi:hypothetical protein
MCRHAKAASPDTAAVVAAISGVASGMVSGTAANARGMVAGTAISAMIVRNVIASGRMANVSSGASATSRRIRIHPLPSSRR